MTTWRRGFLAHVPGGIEAVGGGPPPPVGENIPLVIQVGHALEQFGGRFVPGKDEEAEGLPRRGRYSVTWPVWVLR